MSAYRLVRNRAGNETNVRYGDPIAVTTYFFKITKVMKKNNRKMIYTIIGYADKGTGSKAFNECLSKARAEAVYNCLIKEFGVPTYYRLDMKEV